MNQITDNSNIFYIFTKRLRKLLDKSINKETFKLNVEKRKNKSNQWVLYCYHSDNSFLAFKYKDVLYKEKNDTFTVGNYFKINKLLPNIDYALSEEKLTNKFNTEICYFSGCNDIFHEADFLLSCYFERIYQEKIGKYLSM